ncbi:MAG: tRNA (uridine(34)/cytosine(34)/5-carboxymethylaminomethyluridine(34)-2'-O)-methyltransferase TrmL [Clostridia bacterium]|nr:tRNA (uridine(34)/cytosine(34)/5-carboxymethylaminomethyluridine(34)-2'-O)-methyltransferase TrmL [Clostridia bacterium]
MAINVVLVEPEIPQNTGNIVRTCGGTGANLHLVKPLGFSVEDRYLKRAGLDYWHLVDIKYYDCYNDVVEAALKENPDASFYLCTTKAKKNYTDIKFKDGDYIVLGKETKGLPLSILEANPDSCIRIPMREDFRCLNLSNAAAIILYEAMNQLGFPDMF